MKYFIVVSIVILAFAHILTLSDLSPESDTEGMTLSEYLEYKSDLQTITEVKSVKPERKGVHFLDFNQSLSDSNCMWHSQAEKLNRKDKQGNQKLEDRRYKAVYKNYYFIDKRELVLKDHKTAYPDDTVLENTISSSNHSSEQYVVFCNMVKTTVPPGPVKTKIASKK